MHWFKDRHDTASSTACTEDPEAASAGCGPSAAVATPAASIVSISARWPGAPSS